MRDCRTFRTEIEEASGAMPLGGAAREHVGACAACEGFYRERASVRRLVGELEKVVAPSDFEFRLRARMAAAGDAGRRRRSSSFFRPAFASIAAAACLLVLAGSLYFWPGQKGSPTAGARGVNEEQARTSQDAGKDEKDGVRSVAQPGSNQADGRVSVASPIKVDDPDRHEQRVVRVPQRARAKQSVAGDGRVSAANSEFTHHAAQVIAGPGRFEQSAARNAAQRIPLRASSEPLHVVLRDERGATQRATVRSVSFGSQEMVARGRMTSPASLKSKEGVW